MPGLPRFLAAIAALAVALAVTVAAPAGARAPSAAVPAGFSPSSTSWTSADSGWVLGWAPCDGQPCATLLHTTDGGATWSQVTAPDVRPSEVGDQTRVFFAEGRGHSLGVITNGRDLYVSADAAHSWRPMTLPGADLIGGIGADASSVFVVGEAQDGDQVTATTYSSPIVHPRWRTVRGVTATSPGGLYSTMSVVAGSGRAVQVSSSTYGGVVKLWTALNGHRYRSAYPCSPRSVMYPGMTRDRQQFVLCSFDPGRGRMFKQLRTGSAGDHFMTVVGDAPTAGITSDFAVAGDSTIAIGATMAGAGLVHMSFDGGTTWETPLAVPDSGPVRDLAFQDARHGVLVVGYGLSRGSAVYRTTDGGHTWSRLDL